MLEDRVPDPARHWARKLGCLVDTARQLQNSAGLGPADRLVRDECRREVVVPSQLLGDHPGVLDCLRSALPDAGGGRMCRVTEQDYPAPAPAQERIDGSWNADHGRETNALLCRDDDRSRQLVVSMT